MALSKTGTVSAWTENNRTRKATAKTVELVVVNDALVPDTRDINPGVISGLKFYNNVLI